MMAIATGVAVANNYYVQPLLEAIRRSFHTGPATAGLIVTAAQIGYAAGLVFLLPLGDLLERRRLVVAMSLVCAGGLVAYSFAPDLGVVFAAAVLVGGTSVLAQIIVSFAASLAEDAERGRVVGTVMSGLLLGILLARTVAGYIAQLSSWRVVYLVAAGVTALLGLVSYIELPRYKEDLGLSYPAVLASVFALFRDEPTLRRRSLYGGLSFGAFSVLWTTLAFLLSKAPYHYSTGTIGLFGLVGAAGAAMASLAGRLADRGKQAAVTTLTSLAILVAFVVLWALPHLLGALIAGIVLLDLGCQGLHISNQSEIYKLAPKARSRVNAAYMTSYFIGGTLGSVGAALCYGAAGWAASCGLGSAFGAVTFVVSLGERRRGLRQGRAGA
jgi:predicted MFS family arabinose efflux permease